MLPFPDVLIVKKQVPWAKKPAYTNRYVHAPSSCLNKVGNKGTNEKNGITYR